MEQRACKRVLLRKERLKYGAHVIRKKTSIVHVGISLALLLCHCSPACTRPDQPQPAVSHTVNCVRIHCLESASIGPGFG